MLRRDHPKVLPNLRQVPQARVSPSRYPQIAYNFLILKKTTSEIAERMGLHEHQVYNSLSDAIAHYKGTA